MHHGQNIEAYYNLSFCIVYKRCVSHIAVGGTTYLQTEKGDLLYIVVNNLRHHLIVIEILYSI